MKISALAQRTGVAVGTIKFYLREGVVPPGRATSRTTAEYDEAHVERIRLVRALTDAGGLGISAVRRIITAIDTPDPARLDVLATAQDALLAEKVPAGSEGGAGARSTGCASEGDRLSEQDGSRARSWVRRRGWSTFGEDQLVARLDRVWRACEDAGVAVDEELLDDYAEAMEAVARLDLESVPAEADGAVRRVVVGTVMLEPVLSTLRMLAQRELSVRRDQGQRGTTCS